MKIKNLKIALIAVFAFVGISAFAVTDPKLDNVAYKVTGTETGADAAHAISVTVKSVDSEFTTLAIPASFYKTNVDDTKTYFKVVGFESSWTNAGAPAKNITEKLTTLTINADNLTSFANAYAGLTALTSLTIKDASETPTITSFATLALTAGVCNTLTSIDVEETGVTATGLFFQPSGTAFAKLTSVKLPKGLVTISANAFEGSKVTALAVPATVTTIGIEAFKDAAIETIDLSNAKALATIGDDAFNNSALTALNLNNCEALVSIGVRAFYKAEKLAKLQMSGLKDGDKFTTIKAAAFAETAIPAANIPASVTTVEAWAFENCKKLTQLSAMAGLTKISDYMFRGCEALETVSLNENITEIGAQAFKGCKALTTVNFKADPEAAVLTTIGNSAFEGCESLAALDLTATAITSVKGNVGAWFVGCTSLAEVKLPATVTSIGAEAFGDCVIENLDLSNTNIPTLNAIFRRPGGVYATADKPYASLKSIILPETCTRIFDYSSALNGVFSYCTSLEEITIPTAFENYASDDAVPAYAFYYCTSLKNVNYEPTFKAAYQVFNDEAFLGCTPFVKINTNSYYYTTWTVPTNATFGTTKLTIKTVADKGTSGKFFAKFCPVSACRINPADAKVYSVYVDQGVAYLQALIKRNGMYQINAGDHVIIKTDEAKEITATPVAWGLTPSVTVDDVFSLADDTPTADVHDNTSAATYGPAQSFAAVYFSAGDDYIYRLTNNDATGGFGFTFFSGATMKADQFFIISDKNPNAGGRLQTVWLDENGFVEEDGATAIQKVEAEGENGAIYNLQGVRVKAAKKGLYIQNGKKYIMK